MTHNHFVTCVYSWFVVALCGMCLLCGIACDNRPARRHDSADERESKIETECGPYPNSKDLKQYELTLQIVDSPAPDETEIMEQPFTFPFGTKYKYFRPDEEEHPPFAYKIRYPDPLSNHKQLVAYSLERPSQASDGMFEFFDLRRGERIILHPDIEISMVRVTIQKMDDISKKLRDDVRTYQQRIEEWENCRATVSAREKRI